MFLAKRKNRKEFGGQEEGLKERGVRWQSAKFLIGDRIKKETLLLLVNPLLIWD